MQNISQAAGFEPARAEPIWFRVKRLNHSATTASYILVSKLNLNTSYAQYIFQNRLGFDTRASCNGIFEKILPMAAKFW